MNDQQRKQLHTFWRRFRVSNKAHIGSFLVILLALICSGQLAGPRTAGAAPQASNPIKHIVIMVKENRSFDGMFGTFPGADGATTYKDPKGKIHPLNHEPDHLVFDLAHNYPAFLTA